jgi:SpoVK/Ycf46/Vps4 family AAA+-type ATPase
MTGLERVKLAVNELVAVTQINKARERAGLPVRVFLPHLVFSGNPGTGKTTVARILGEVLRDIGVLSSGHVVEVDRAGLVDRYVGGTAAKTLAVCDSAIGGILFVDEAYTLVEKSKEHNFGQEAIDALLKHMEDHRGQYVIVVAGYKDKIGEFVKSNPGLESRFDTYIEFDDYSPAEMCEIFTKMCAEHGYTLDTQAQSDLILVVSRVKGLSGFANARTIRKLFEKAITAQSVRLTGEDSAELTQNALAALTPADIMSSGIALQ